MNEFLAEARELAEMVKSDGDRYDMKKQADIVLDLLDDVEAEENYAVVLKLTEKERTTLVEALKIILELKTQLESKKQVIIK